MKRLLAQLKEKLMPYAPSSPLHRTRLLEGFFVVSLIAWGVNVVYNDTSFELPIYVVVRDFMPQRTWGAIAIALGLIRAVGLIVNGYWRRSPLFRGLGTLCSGLFWLFLGGLLLLTSIKLHTAMPPGAVFYPVFFLFEAYCMVAAGYDTERSGALTLGKV